MASSSNVSRVGTFRDIARTHIPVGTDTIRTSGYATAGRGGADYVAVEDDGSPLLAHRIRSADGALWEIEPGSGPVDVATFGAICDGVSHPLSERFSTIEDAKEVYPLAASLNDEIDWAAFQVAMDFAREKGSSVGWSGHAISNRTLIVAGYPQKVVNGSHTYDDSFGQPKRTKQIGNLIGLGGGGSEGSTTGKKAEITFTNSGSVSDTWPATSKSAFDPAFPIKIGFLSTRSSDTSEAGGWTLVHMQDIHVNGPANGIGVLDANGSNKTVREVYFSGNQRYGYVSCNNRSTRWKDCTFQTHRRAGIGLLYLSQQIIEVSNTGGFFNDGLQIVSCAFSSGRRFADIEDHGSQSEGIRLITGCSHTNGATFGYIGRKGVSPSLHSNWYEGIFWPQFLMGSDNYNLPNTSDFNGILPEGNGGISTTQFVGGWAYAFLSQGNYFGDSSAWPTQACIRADNRGTAALGPNITQSTRCYIERVSLVGGIIQDSGLSPTSVAPEVYFRGPRQLYFRCSDMGEALGQPDGILLPVSPGRGVRATSLSGGAVVSPIVASGVVKDHAFTLAQAAGGASVRFSGWHTGLWALTISWSASDGFPEAIAEAELMVESAHSVGDVRARDRLWATLKSFRLLDSLGSRNAPWLEVPELSVWPRNVDQARSEIGQATPMSHVDLTILGLAAGGARQITVAARFVGSLDIDADVSIYILGSPADLAPFGPTESRGSSAPTQGNWTTGSLRWNSNPSAGGAVGFVCVEGGSPGIWNEFGVISS